MKPNRCSCAVVRAVGLTALLVVLCGCAADAGRGDLKGEHRTIQVESPRDTPAARSATHAGIEHLTRGELDKAQAAFERALLSDPQFGPAHNNLGKVFFARQRWYSAAWHFEIAGNLLPQSADPHNNLGMVYEQVGQLDQAVIAYEQALQRTPDHHDACANLARALVRRGDSTDALRTLLQQVRENDTRPEWRTWALRQLTRLNG